MSTETLSPSRFVIRAPGDGAVDDAALAALATLAAIGHFEPLPSARGGWLFTAKKPFVGAQPGWRTLQSRLPASMQVLPQIDGGDDQPRFPTGRIAVRWREAAADGMLRALGQKHGLDLVQRTRFNDRQALFAPQASNQPRYLPGLLPQLQADPAVEAAWLDTESAYRRDP